MQVTESLSWDAINQSDQDTAYSTVPVEVLKQPQPFISPATQAVAEERSS
jgi:hypothetical protein